MTQILSKITDEELEFCELFYYPIALAECLFSNADNLAEFDENKYCEIRRYQAPLLSFDHFIDVENDARLDTKRKKFQARKNVADIYCFGGRGYGKSWALIIVDLLLYIIYAVGEQCLVASVDMNHIDGVLSKVKSAFESHPFIKLFYKKASATTSKYYLETKNGVTIKSVNTNPTSADEGKKAWYGPHANRIYIEEASLLSTESAKASRDSEAEIGAVKRFSGMCNFNSFSPAGEIYYDKSNYPKVVNSPQLVNPTFTAEKEEERAKEFGGKSSIEFRQFVLGEVLGDSIKVVDLEKVNFNREKPVISFEINDDNFVHFRELIVVNRPEIAELGYIASDVSDVNITEILLIYKWNHQYHYRYKITLRGLDDTKHKTIFKWLINKAGIDYTSIDHSVDENEYVLCKINKTIKYLKFKEIDKYIKENKQCLIEVPTFNDDKLEWKRAKLIKHWHEGEMCKVTTSPGNYNVRVTDSHSIMIYTKDGIKEKYVKDIKTNDWMLSPKNFNIENKEYQIVKYKLPKKNKYSQDIYKDLKVDEKFAYLLGWAVAEGSSKTTSYQLGMGGDEEDKANELLNLHREIFNIESGYLLKCKKEKINTPYIQGRRLNVNLDRLCVVFGGGQGNKELFLNLCGSGAKNKQVPEVIFNSPIMVQKEFLRGLFEGDGNLRRNRYTLKVVSEKLRNEVMTLLQMTGEFPSYYDIPDQGRIFYVVSYAKNSQTKGKKIGVPYKILDIQNGKKRINEKIYKYNFGKEKKIKFDKLMNGDWLFEKVIKKEKYRYSGWVYDFEVEDNHTFVAGVGSLLCHNTDAMGRVLVNYLQKEFGESFVYGIGFNEKIKTDIEIDEKTHKPKRVKGDFVYKEEDVSIWSVRCLLRLLYDGKLELAYDVAIEKQLSKLVAEQRITKLIYRVKSKDDHAFQALTCFSILEFKLEFDHITEARKKKMIPVLGVGA